MPKNVLLIAYYFPPWPGAGALRPGRLAKLLPEFGWTPTTLAGPAKNAAPEYGEVVAVKPFGDPYAPRIRGLWRVLPGPARWYPGALRTALSLVSRRRFDAVFSTYNPGFNHMLAAEVAQRAGIPWLADYSEAWTGNRLLEPKFPIAREYNRRIEVRCLRGATAITCATPGIRSLVSRLHGRADVELIENAVDLGEWDRIPNLPPPAFTFLYAGGLHCGLLTPEPLFAAVAKLRRAGHPAGDAARFEFYCHNEGRLVLEVARRWGVEAAVTVHPATLRERVLAAERRAAALLILFPMRPISIVPSKLYEYYGAGRPILAIGPAQSKAHLGGLIEGNRLGYFSTSEDECVAAVVALHERFLSGQYRTDPNPVWSPPTAELTTEQFADVLDRITGSRRSSDTRTLLLAKHA
jgi:hypothetical protein